MASIYRNNFRYKVFAFSILASSVTGCRHPVRNNPEAQIESSGEVYMPVFLQSNRSSIMLSEFFDDITAIDSVNAVAKVVTSWSPGKDTVFLITNESSPKLFTLNVYSKGSCRKILMRKTTRVDVKFEYYDKHKKYKSVKVKGEFNNWNTDATPLHNVNGRWTGKLSLTPGRYSYKLMGDGAEISDDGNPDSVSNGMGGFNNILAVPTPDRSRLPVLTAFAVRNDRIVITTKSFPEKIIALWQNQEIDVEINNNECILTMPAVAAKCGRSFIRVYAYNDEGISNDLSIPLDSGKVINSTIKLTRNDKAGNVMYFALVDRFVDGNKSNTRKTPDARVLDKANYYGGDLQGIIQQMDSNYFDNLGVNCLWISPIVQNPLGAYQEWPAPRRWFSGYHGYWPVTLTTIDGRFGNDETFSLLVKKAHAKNMNVLLDFVSNHVHSENMLYVKHPEYFTSIDLPDGRKNIRLWDEYRLTTWFEPFMPDINYELPKVVDLMTDSAIYWLTKFDIDGFRHDAVKHVPSQFWLTLTKKIKQQVSHPHKKSIYQVGETFGSRELIGSYVSNGQLDGQFDFNTFFDASRVLLNDNESFEVLKNSILESCNYYGYHHLMCNISGNHDMPRFIASAGKAISGTEDAKEAGWARNVTINDTIGYSKLIQLEALNMMLPGIPCIYYGDEYGDIGAGDPDNRRMARFGDQLTPAEKQTLDKTKRLIYLRRSHMAPLYGETSFIRADHTVLIMMRKYFDQCTILVLNKGKEETTVTFDMPEGIDKQSLKTLFGNKLKPGYNNLVLPVPAYGCEIIYTDKWLNSSTCPISY